jgi:hypothetical protein
MGAAGISAKRIRHQPALVSLGRGRSGLADGRARARTGPLDFLRVGGLAMDPSADGQEPRLRFRGRPDCRKAEYALADFVVETQEFWAVMVSAKSVPCMEKTHAMARVASCSSSPEATRSRAIPTVAHKEMMLTMLRRSATFSPHFKTISDRKHFAVLTNRAAERKCNPSSQGTTTLMCFILSYQTARQGILFSGLFPEAIKRKLRLNGKEKRERRIKSSLKLAAWRGAFNALLTRTQPK